MIQTDDGPRDSYLILLHVIPKHGSVLDLSLGVWVPAHDEASPFEQVACKLDMANVSAVVHRVYIVMLENPASTEVVHESLVFEVFLDLLGLLFIYLSGLVGQALLFPNSPLALRKVSSSGQSHGWVWNAAYHNYDSSIGPGCVDILDQLDVRVVEVLRRYLIGVAVVITTKLDDNQVGWLLAFVVPNFHGMVRVMIPGSRTRI